MQTHGKEECFAKDAVFALHLAVSVLPRPFQRGVKLCSTSPRCCDIAPRADGGSHGGLERRSSSSVCVAKHHNLGDAVERAHENTVIMADGHTLTPILSGGGRGLRCIGLLAAGAPRS